MKYIKSFIIFICLIISQEMHAVEYDSSIDSDIRKQYNVDELPALPKSVPSKTIMPQELHSNKITGKTYTIKSGTKIVLVSKSKISDWNREGAKVSFLLQNPVSTQEGEIIPSGTLFKGVIIDSHTPQFAGNGGLIKLNINEIHYNGIMSVVNSNLSEANTKKVFLSNIKGKRKYWKNCAKAMTPGIKTYKTMKKAAKELTVFPVINILSIIPITIGSVVYILNIPAAPVASVFMKGGALSLPSGTVFQITILGDNKIRG